MSADNCVFDITDTPGVLICAACNQTLESPSPPERTYRECLPNSLPDGPGTELEAMLDEMAVKPIAGCNCTYRRRRMNAWGPSGCHENRAAIVSWLKDSYDKSTLREKMTAVLKCDALLAMRIAMSRDIFGTLVDEAIRRADQKRR